MSQIALDLDALQHLEDQAVKAAGADSVVRFQRVPELGDNVVAQIGRDGKVELIDRKTRRYHMLGNVTAIQEWLAYAAEKWPTSIITWVDYNRIEIVLNDDSDVRPPNGAYCILPYSAEFELVRKFAGEPVYYDQRSFVRLLRSEIGQCLNPPQALIRQGSDYDARKELIDTFSVLKFESRNRTAGGVTPNADFLGREQAAEITSGTLEKPRDVPQTIVLYVTTYRDAVLTGIHEIPCEVLINYETCKLALAPSLTDVQRVADKSLEEVIKSLYDGLPVNSRIFTGKP